MPKKELKQVKEFLDEYLPVDPELIPEEMIKSRETIREKIDNLSFTEKLKWIYYFEIQGIEKDSLKLWFVNLDYDEFMANLPVKDITEFDKPENELNFYHMGFLYYCVSRGKKQEKRYLYPYASDDNRKDGILQLDKILTKKP